MKDKYRFKLVLPAALLGMVFAVPVFAQYSPNSTNPNAPATATNPNAPATAGQDMHQAGRELEQAGSDTAAAASDTYQGSKRAVKDVTITAEVKAALERDKAIPSAHEIHVHTKAGIVTLNGNVSSPEASQHAARLAQETKGVRSVNNQLMVMNSSRAE